MGKAANQLVDPGEPTASQDNVTTKMLSHTLHALLRDHLERRRADRGGADGHASGNGQGYKSRESNPSVGALECAARMTAGS